MCCAGEVAMTVHYEVGLVPGACDDYSAPDVGFSDELRRIGDLVAQRPLSAYGIGQDRIREACSLLRAVTVTSCQRSAKLPE